MITKSHILEAAIVLALALNPLARANAQDASFGCKVLLCAGASNPGWPAIPYCVPVMQTLFSILSRRGGWPACPEASASGGGVGYAPYEACPTPLAAYSNQSSVDPDTGAVTPVYVEDDQRGDQCADPQKLTQAPNASPGSLTPIDRNYTPIPRATTDKPYYVDIAQPSGVTRFRFNLSGN